MRTSPAQRRARALYRYQGSAKRDSRVLYLSVLELVESMRLQLIHRAKGSELPVSMWPNVTAAIRNDLAAARRRRVTA